MPLAPQTRRRSIAIALAPVTPPTFGTSTGTAEPPRLLRSRAVCERTGLSRTTLWRLERRGDFPRHRQISVNAIGWLEEDVTNWIRARVPR